MERERVEAYLRAVHADAMAHLRALVEQNSFTFYREGVCAVGRRCAALFEPLGFTARFVPSVTQSCGDHVLLSRAAAASGAPRLVFVSHLDTVYPQEEEARCDFRWREEAEGWISGPGVADIKGGTVLVWMALSALRECLPGLFEGTELHVLLNATEEGACADFPPLARGIARGARACLVYEAGTVGSGAATEIVVARKGAGRFRVDVSGRAAHSGNAHAFGASAIRELADKILRIEALTDPPRELTFNVGRIGGGTSVNSVPAHAWGLGDFRAWTPEVFREARAAVHALAGEGVVRSREDDFACGVEISDLPGYPPWPKNAASDSLGALFVETGSDLGQAIACRARNGASDGSHLWDLAPTVDGLGPIGRDTHRASEPRESVLSSSFVPRALLSVAAIERILPS